MSFVKKVVHRVANVTVESDLKIEREITFKCLTSSVTFGIVGKRKFVRNFQWGRGSGDGIVLFWHSPYVCALHCCSF